MKYQVIPTYRFEKDLRKLSKQYPLAVDDVEEILENLEDEIVGDAIPGLDFPGDKVFKVRARNSSANRGTRGGFRLIYYLITSENEIYMLTMYSKSDKADLTKDEIKELVKKYVPK